MVLELPFAFQPLRESEIPAAPPPPVGTLLASLSAQCRQAAPFLCCILCAHRPPHPYFKHRARGPSRLPGSRGGRRSLPCSSRGPQVGKNSSSAQLNKNKAVSQASNGTYQCFLHAQHSLLPNVLLDLGKPLGPFSDSLFSSLKWANNSSKD